MFGHLPGLPHIKNESFDDVVLEGNCPPSPPLATPLALASLMIDQVRHVTERNVSAVYVGDFKSEEDVCLSVGFS